MHVGLDLGSLMCMNKIIPDLGLGRECAPLKMQMKRMSTEWSQQAGTLSHRPGASACSSLLGSAFISSLFSDNRIWVNKRMGASVDSGLEKAR